MRGALRGGKRIEGEKAVHIERTKQANCFGCDVSHADSPNDAVTRLTSEMFGTFGPATLPDLTILHEEAVRECKNQQQDRLRYWAHDSSGGDVYGDAALRAGVEVHIVITNAASADGAKSRDLLERLAGDSRLERNDDVEICQLRRGILRAIFAQEFVLDSGYALQQIQSNVGKHEAAVLSAKVGGKANPEFASLHGIFTAAGRTHDLLSSATTQS